MAANVDGAGARIALIGNVANCLLPVALALREEGFAADLFIADNAPQVSRPENVDPDLASASWVRRGRWLPFWSVLLPWSTPLVRELSSYDLIVASGPGPIYAQWSGRPWCWWVSGHDLTAAPFPWAFRRTYPTVRRKVAAYPLALWQRRAARRAQRIWVQPFAPFTDALQRLRIGHPPVSDAYLPLIVGDGLGPAVRTPSMQGLLTRMEAADLAVLHPSRIMIGDSPAARRSGQWKGNDQLIRGLGTLVQRLPQLDVVLVMIDSSASRDTSIARRLIADLGIEDRVLWAVPEKAESFTRSEMAALYAACDVVAVEFAAGWFGTVVLEGLAMGKPVVSYIDDAAMRLLYPEGHPIRSVREVGDIAEELQQLASKERRDDLGNTGRRWINEHHRAGAVNARYVAEVSAALRQSRGEHAPQP